MTKAHDATRKPPATIPADASIGAAAQLMDAAAVGAVIVTDEGVPVGIVTDRDLAVRAVARHLPLDSRVDAVMSTDLVTLPPDAELQAAIRIFGERPIRRIPVVDRDRAVGMISIDDLLVDLSHDLGDVCRAVAGQVLFGHPQAGVPVLADRG